MLYKIGRNPIYRAPIPALIGGINTNSSSDIVADNQLSNCLNMMAMDGILRTRPGFVTDVNGAGIQNLQSTAKKIKQYDFSAELDGKYGKVISVWCNNSVRYYHADKDGMLSDLGIITTDGEIINEFTVTGNDGLYSYVTFENENDPQYKIYVLKDSAEANTWEEAELYIPTVITNGVTNGLETSGTLSGDFLVGYNLLCNKYKAEITAYNEMLMFTESYHPAVYKLPHKIPVNGKVNINITLKDGSTKKFDITKITDEDIVSFNEELGFYACIKNRETIIFQKPDENNVLFTAQVIDDLGKIDWDVDMMYDSEFEVPDDTDVEDLAKEIEKARKNLKTERRAKCIELPGYNNIVVTAEYEPDSVAREHIFSATCSAWFGGNQGIASGTRLFIGGMEGEYKNVLRWTDLSNPLYFPENCFSKVGEPNQPITAFGKQGDMLVVFKPFEIYAASYMLQDAPIEDAAYDFISDLTVTAAVFPLTQISSNIGCDCPGTIELCRNRLCWIHSNGKAYTLVSSSQYNEKNIYELSDPIKRALPNISKEELKNASSTDWEGYYVLSAGKHIFLMQYESYGYSKIYSYTSEEAASHKLPWFYLSLPFAPRSVMNIDNSLISVSENEYKTKVILHRADRNSVKDMVIKDEETEYLDIPSMVQSKLFDFSRPELKKVICHILAEIGGTDGNSIVLSVVTDRSRRSDFIENLGSDVSPLSQYNEYSAEGKRVITPIAETIERTVTIYEGGIAETKDLKLLDSSAPDFFRILIVNPAVFGIRKFAVHISSEGAFSLGQVCIEYKMLGSVN